MPIKHLIWRSKTIGVYNEPQLLLIIAATKQVTELAARLARFCKGPVIFNMIQEMA